MNSHTPPAIAAASAWRWVPSLYFSQAVPYVVVMALTVPMYKRLGLSNTDIAFYTSWLNLPWILKPLWSPLVDRFRTKRGWVVTLQFFFGAALAAIALSLPGPWFFQATLALFMLLAFASATHDIAADGFYLLALPPRLQAAFVGVRSTFYRLASIAGQGGLVYLAGMLEEKTGDVRAAWAWVFVPPAVFFVLAGLYHAVMLPRPASDRPATSGSTAAADWATAFASFFRRPGIGATLAFLLLYRLGEAQLVRLSQAFLLDNTAAGGLGLSTKQVGLVYGTIGVGALVVGGILGGLAIARWGLRRMLWPMLAAMHLPNLFYIALATGQPEQLTLVAGAVAVEQMGYGFGFAAYMVYLMKVADGPHRTAHYAIGTGFMALGVMLPGMPAGWIQAQLGYPGFFVWVCIATLPSVWATAAIRRQADYGSSS